MLKPEIEKYLDELRSEDMNLRYRAADALAKIADASAVPALIKLSRDKQANVRFHAIEVLSQIKEPLALEYLALALRDKRLHIRYYAIEVLMKIGTSAVALLSAALKDEEPLVREIVASALGKLGEGEAVPALIESLQDADANVQLQAAKSLNRLGDSFTLPHKVIACSKLSAQQRINALEALRRVRFKRQSAYFALEYDFPDTRELCQVVRLTGDEELKAGAQIILNWLNGENALLHASQRDDSNANKELLRPVAGFQQGSNESLLRASTEESSHG